MQDILDRNESTFGRIEPQATVLQAVQLLHEKRVGALPVMDGERLAGIFSERDFVRLMALHGLGCVDLPVADVMTTRVHTVAPDTSVVECLTLMIDRYVRHMPVVAGGTVVGVVSNRNLAFEVVAKRESLLAALDLRGAGRPPRA